jgi:hypothetical protein
VQWLFIMSPKNPGGPWDLETREPQGNPSTCYQTLLETIQSLKNCRSFYIDLNFPNQPKAVEALDALGVTAILLKVSAQTVLSINLSLSTSTLLEAVSKMFRLDTHYTTYI